MHAGHYNIVCPDCGTRMGGCRCMSPGKSTVPHTEPCAACQEKRANAMADFFEEFGVDLNTIPYEEKQPEGTLTDKVLNSIAEDASYVGYAATGQPYSVDMDLRLARRMQNHVPELIAEIRRLRALVSEDQRIAPARPPFPEPTQPLPPPPSGFPKPRRSF